MPVEFYNFCDDLENEGINYFYENCYLIKNYCDIAHKFKFQVMTYYINKQFQGDDFINITLYVGCDYETNKMVFNLYPTLHEFDYEDPYFPELEFNDNLEKEEIKKLVLDYARNIFINYTC